MLSNQWTITAIVALFLCSAVLATPGDNIALHCPYTWSTAPTYSGCTDAGDVTQLTDGVTVGGIHTNIACVGWQGSGTVSITIDLGSKQPIGGVELSMGYLPAFINLWVSDDGVTYYWGGPVNGGEIRAMAWAQQGKPTAKQHVFTVTGLTLAGRYVKFSCYRATQYMFCDEIRVFEGDFDPAGVPHSPISKSSGFESPDKADAIARVRMLYDLEALQNHPQAQNFTAELTALQQQITSMFWIWSLNFEQGMPYTPLHAEVWKLNGQMNRAAGFPQFAIAPGRPYDQQLPLFDPVSPDPCVLMVHLIGNEETLGPDRCRQLLG